jgi:hypothetical protein
MAQPSTAPLPHPGAEGKRPALLKPQYKTAMKEFIVGTPVIINTITGYQLTSTQRIFSFSTWLDRTLLLAAVLTSIGAGVTMPAMNIIFGMSRAGHLSPFPGLINHMIGRMVGSFTAYFSMDASTSFQMFQNAINTCA